MNRKSLILTFIVICYLSFICLDLFGSGSFNSYSNILKYVSVLLCFANALLSGKDCLEKRDALLLQAAMFVTIAADPFLLFLEQYFLGILLFCVVQSIYIIRHSRYSKFHTKMYAISGAAFMSFAFVVVTVSGIDEKAIALAGCLYAFLTFCSLHTAFSTAKAGLYPRNNVVLINTGLWLLMLCDLNIFLNITVPFDHFPGFLAWVFYLPSQLILSESSRR
ncbi:MAG: putative rane protein [Firmicutes bacterium]|nr:putative rane protein [Bacillota bacterium]